MNNEKMYFDLKVASFKQLSSFNIHYNGATINEAHFVWQKTHIQPAMAGLKRFKNQVSSKYNRYQRLRDIF